MAVDFQFDATTDGRPVKIASIVDEHTRECLGGLVERNITGKDLIDELDRIAAERGYPVVLRCDNGPELACTAMADWAHERVGLHFIPPGEPWRNGYVESFNSRVRDECNDINGGDPASPLGYLSREFGRLVVLSTHQPRTRVGYAATQFELLGPGGKPPLNYMRTISAHATDGRWQWDESGEPLPFEDLDRYRARLVRDRFPRPLLLDYLSAMGIEPDNREQFGQAILIKQHVSRQR